MKPTTRTFLAVELDQAIRGAVAKAVRRLQQKVDSVKWVEPDNLHITLKFLGEIPTVELYQVVRAAQQAVADMDPFEVEVAGIGAFPTLAHPRTIWLGIDEGSQELIHLADRVEAELEPLGYPREGRAFKPHLTLGRARREALPSQDLGAILAEYAATGFGRATVDAVTVFSSELSRTGPKYDVVGHAWLR